MDQVRLQERQKSWYGKVKEMNSYKVNWYLATQDIDTGVKTSSQINEGSVTLMHRGKKRKYTKNDSVTQMAKEQYWDNWTYNPQNMYAAYNTPAGQLLVDGVLMITMPALALGRRAKKAIEITRHLAEYID